VQKKGNVMLDKLILAKGRLRDTQEKMKREMFFINRDASEGGANNKKSRYYSLKFSLKKTNAQLETVKEQIGEIKRQEKIQRSNSLDKHILTLCKEAIDKETFLDIVEKAHALNDRQSENTLDKREEV